MAKKSAAQAVTKVSSKPEISSSIDDIFASKPKPKSKALPTPTSISNAIASSSKSTDQPKKKKKKVNAIPAFIPDDPASSAPVNTQLKRKSKKAKSTGGVEVPVRVVEEILDPSVQKAAAPVFSAPVASQVKGLKKGEKRKESGEDDEMFADSRGTGPRRMTEEGFLIYKEAELQIDPEAGGTPLCPFDCECCF